MEGHNTLEVPLDCRITLSRHEKNNAQKEKKKLSIVVWVWAH